MTPRKGQTIQESHQAPSSRVLQTVLCARWWWAPVFSTAIGVWILHGGIVTGEMANAITQGNAGPSAGLLIMSVGPVIAVVTGVLAMMQRHRSP